MRLSRTHVLLACLIILSGIVAWRDLSTPSGLSGKPAKLEAFELSTRPQDDRYLFDYAGALRHYEEGTHRYLTHMAARFHIEALIVTIPSLPEGHDVATLANDLFNGWRIGAEHEGRGLLLLMVDDAKVVKLEVAYMLEDVFTDSFAGFVEDLQLGPYYRADDVGTGLIAVMELLEARAQVKQQQDYTPAQIAQADAELLAGGAGASRELSRYTKDPVEHTSANGRGAGSPEEAWETMLAQWGGNGEAFNVGTYTAMTRRAMGDPTDPDPRTLNALDHWRAADYQILREGNHAVVWFGAADGWENAPFLFCNTGDGWRFDIVHQRRLVIMAEAPKWQVSQGPYPYTRLMPDAWQTTSKDLPLEDGDLYRCTDDTAIAAKMQELEQILAERPDAADAVIELLRLNVITGQRPNLVQPLIQRARQLSPDSPEIYRYAAIYNVNTFFQYETAMQENARYLELRPQDPFGHRMQGFLLYRLGRYADSIEALERAIELVPNDGYAYALMARNYALLARGASGRTKRSYSEQALTMQHRAASVSEPGSQRIDWLNRWLARRLG